MISDSVCCALVTRALVLPPLSLSLSLPQDPVVAADGHSYERTAITTWLQANKIDPKSPATGEGLAHSELLTNWTLRKTIGEAREAELARGAALALDGPL